jgi:hypothetical protein
VTIHLARTRSEFECAFQLLQENRENWGLERHEPEKLWLLKHHALPSTNTIVAMQAGRVIAAICLFGESPYQLPLESQLNLAAFRKNLDGRLAELSLPGFHADFANSYDLQFALYHFAICFGTSYCHYDGFVTEAPLAWASRFAAPLRFEKIYEPVNGRQMLFLNGREGVDFRPNISAGYRPEYHFPEKKFFLVAHQSMPADVLNYLFNERTKLLSSLSDYDLRVLKNVYDYGEYAKILPERRLDLPEKKIPRYPRFPMNCEGFLVNKNGVQEHVQVLDVSREGLKIRTAHTLDAGSSHMLTLSIGINRSTELIASTIWVDDRAEIAGLEVKSSDANWSQLIEYLEKDFLQAA